MTTHIIISIDYELFGNGTGDVMKTMIQPTDEILKILEKHGAKLTIFAEMLEYWAMQDAIKDGTLPTEKYDPCQAIEKQLKNSIAKGHDVQFHMHPQWIDSKYQNGKWKLNNQYWKTPSVPGGLGSIEDPKSLIGLFHRGKTELEALCRPENDAYRCIGYRAGAHCIQPHKTVFQAMEQTGFLADSTVFPGGQENKGYTVYDFQDVKDHNPYRPSLDNISKHDSSGKILELPLYAENILLSKLLGYRNKNLPVQTVSTSSAPPQTQQNKKKFSLYRNKRWDYDQLNSKGMSEMLDRALKTRKGKTNILVMTGHAKTFNNSQGLNDFLKYASGIAESQPDIKFSTMQTAVEDYLKTEKRQK